MPLGASSALTCHRCETAGCGPFARTGRRRGACRGRGLRVDRPRWTRGRPPRPRRRIFATFGLVRQWVASVIGPARAGRRGRSPPTPPAGTTPPASGSSTTAVSLARRSSGCTALVASASATRHQRPHGGPRAHARMTRRRIGIAARARRGAARLLRSSAHAREVEHIRHGTLCLDGCLRRAPPQALRLCRRTTTAKRSSTERGGTSPARRRVQCSRRRRSAQGSRSRNTSFRFRRNSSRAALRRKK